MWMGSRSCISTALTKGSMTETRYEYEYRARRIPFDELPAGLRLCGRRTRGSKRRRERTQLRSNAAVRLLLQRGKTAGNFCLARDAPAGEPYTVSCARPLRV